MTTPLTDRDKAHILEQRANKENGKYRCLDCGEVKRWKISTKRN